MCISSWSHVADREGFIVVYPNAHLRRFWQIECERRLKVKCNIDEERIYMQGMSLGNAMTLVMARHFGNYFAAMAGSAGPSTIGHLFDENGNPKNNAGPLTTWQARMEFDQGPPGSTEPVEDVVAKTERTGMGLSLLWLCQLNHLCGKSLSIMVYMEVQL